MTVDDRARRKSGDGLPPGAEIRFSRLVWLLPTAFAIHEAEEWFILDWYRAYWQNVGNLTVTTVRTWLVFASLVGFALTGLASLLPVRWTAHVVALVFAFPFLHSFLHIYWVFNFGAYSPGGVTAILMLIPAFVGVMGYAVRHRLAHWWFVVLVCAINLPRVVMAIRLGDTLPDGGLPWYRLSRRIAELLGLVT